MSNRVTFVFALILCPVSVIIIRHFLFHLEPLAHWKLPMSSIGFAASEGGAFIAFYYPKKNASIRIRIWTFAIALAITFTMAYVYGLAMEFPPEERWVFVYNFGAYASYCATYFLIGYVFSRVFAFVVEETRLHFGSKD